MITPYEKIDLPDPMKRWLLSSSKPKASSAQESPAKGDLTKEIVKALSTSQIDFVPTLDVPEKYEHGKPFLPSFQLQEGPWEMRKFHEWYMRACRAGLSIITASVPAIVYLSGDNYLMLDFKDMHALFRLDKLDVNLISVWCL
jgi:hypothetical protein